MSKKDLRMIISGKELGFIDVNRGKVVVGKIEYDIPANTPLRPGDTIEIEKKKLTVVGFNPSYYDTLSQRSFQSIKTHDAAYMISVSGIHSGSTVLEAGIGNGSLTAHLIWVVAPSGRVVSVDIERKALDLSSTILRKVVESEVWEPIIGDVRNYKFSDTFDAVFLDIPDPWNAIANVSKYMRGGGSLIVYSPNFNQIERAVDVMNENDFHVIENLEILKRKLIVRHGRTRPDSDMIGHTAFLSVAVKKSGFRVRVK